MFNLIFDTDDEPDLLKFEITLGEYTGLRVKIKDISLTEDTSFIEYLFALQDIPESLLDLVQPDNIPESLKETINEIFSQIVHQAMKNDMMDNHERANEEIRQGTTNSQGNSSE